MTVNVIAPTRTEAMKSFVLRMTKLELRMLRSVAGNGWGDGDFAQWLGNKKEANACRRILSKLDDLWKKKH